MAARDDHAQGIFKKWQEESDKSYYGPSPIIEYIKIYKVKKAYRNLLNTIFNIRKSC